MLEPVPQTFDLQTEPWILVRRLDESTGELSLRDVFAQAHELRDLRGDLPTQVFAIARLLLAILHRALEPLITQPEDDWRVLWTQTELPLGPVNEYLDEWRHAFDLMHPQRPFLQVAGLRTATGEHSGLERLVADVPNGIPLFTTRAAKGLARIGQAEAARWLVHCQAFDPSGIKSGAVGDDRVKGGKGYPIGTAWAGALGGVIVEGATLRETLLLNLVLATGTTHDIPVARDDLPVWERAPLTAAAERPEGAPVTGQIDLLTWPSRRMRLVADGTDVVGVVLGNGDRLMGHNQFDEQMTAWRRSEPQEKKLGRVGVYLPRAHDPSRSMWRGLAALLPQRVTLESGEPAPFRPPGVVTWIGALQDKGILPATLVVRTRAIGMAYGPQNSTVAETIDDSLAFHSVLVAERGRSLARLALSAVEQSEAAVNTLVQLAANLAVAAGGESDRVMTAARELGYHVLDEPFRRWLAGLEEGAENEAAHRWSDGLRELIGSEGDALIAASGPSAWVGRTNSRGKHLSTPEADIWFRASLARAAPRRPDPPSDLSGTGAADAHTEAGASV